MSDIRGMLYVVATPIGNLDDLSPRAARVLNDADVVLAEDTRHSGRLLKRIGSAAKLRSLHEHNEARRIDEVLALLAAGQTVALVSDAGTPLVSDPGFRLVRAAGEAGCALVPVPGPCAAIAALSVAGLASDRFAFEGFLPSRQSARRQQLGRLAADPRTLIFYEAPHRIAACLEDLVAVFGACRRGFVGRELTKVHETGYRGTLADLAARARDDSNMARGELVIVVEGAPEPAAAARADLDATLRVLLQEMSVKQAARLASALLGLARNETYRRALELAAEEA